MKQKCHICKREFSSSQGLSGHYASHTKEELGTIPVKVKGQALNISCAELEAYRQEHTVCDICGNPEKSLATNQHGNGFTKRLAIDHDHKTNEFRGLLCYRCNVAYEWLIKYGHEISKYNVV